MDLSVVEARTRWLPIWRAGDSQRGMLYLFSPISLLVLLHTLEFLSLLFLSWVLSPTSPVYPNLHLFTLPAKFLFSSMNLSLLYSLIAVWSVRSAVGRDVGQSQPAALLRVATERRRSGCFARAAPGGANLLFWIHVCLFMIFVVFRGIIRLN